MKNIILFPFRSVSLDYWATVTKVLSNLRGKSLYTECGIEWKIQAYLD